MGKIYTTDIISIGDHSLDAPRMVQIDDLIEDGLHSEAGYLTEESGTTKLTDAEIAEMGYIKTYTDTDTDTNTQLSQAQVGAYATSEGFIKEYTDTNTQLTSAQVGAYAVDEGFIKEYTDTNTQLTSAEIAAMGYTGDQTAAQIQSLGMARFYSNAVLNSSTTTATFIAELTSDYGCFNNNQVTLKVQWSYAGSSDLVTGHATIGTIELAGCTIETWGTSYKHVRISRPNTGTGGHMVVEYNDQSAGYAPGWREIWTSESDGAGSGLDADLLDGQQGSYYYPASNPNNYTGDTQLTSAEIAAMGYTGDQDLSGYLPLSGGALTGPISITGDASYVANWGYNTLVLQDTSGYPGINFRNGNTSILQRMRAGSIDMQWAYSTNASATGVGQYADGMKLSGNSLTLYGDVRSPTFYDSNDTTYYVNPAGNSLLNRLELNDDIDMRGQVGTWITSDVFNDSIGWNNNYGVYIGSNVGGTHYLRGNGTFTTDGSTHTLYHTGNIPTWNQSTTGTANNATNLGGIDASEYAHGTEGSFTVGGSRNNFYPVKLSKGRMRGVFTIYRENVHENGSSFGSGRLIIRATTSGWGHTPLKFSYEAIVQSQHLFGFIASNYRTSYLMVMLRGGTTYRYIGSDGFKLSDGNASGISLSDGRTTYKATDLALTDVNYSGEAMSYRHIPFTNHEYGDTSKNFSGGVTAPNFYGSLTGNASTATTTTGNAATATTAANSLLLNGLTNSASGGANKILASHATNGYLYINNWIHSANGAGLFYDAGVHFHEKGNYMFSNTGLQAANDMRAPIFYDRDDTNYYVNPGATDYSGTFRQHVTIGDSTQYKPNSGNWGARLNVVDKVHAKITVGQDADDMLSVWYAHTGQNSIKFGTETSHNVEFVTGNTTRLTVDTGGTVQATGSLRAPIFYDSNDTNYYVNPGSTSTALNAQGGIKILSSHSGGNIELNYPYGGNNNYAGNMVMFMSEPGITHDGGGIGCNIAPNSPYYGRKYNHGYGVYLRFDKTGGNFEFWNTQSTAGNSSGRGTRRFYGDASGNTFSSASSRAPIFYDTNNTGYYVNPASTSSLNGLTVNGTITGNISGNANTLDNIDSGSFLRSDATDYQNNTIYQRGYLVNETGYRNRGVYGNYNSNKTNHIWSMGTAYKNHASGTNFGNLYGLAYKHTNNTTGGTMAGGHQMVWCSNGSGRSAMGDNIWTSGNVKAPLFYDSNNTAYYLNPASTSNLNVLTLAGTATASNFILSSDERKKTKIKDLTRNNINTNWKSFEMKNDEGEYRTGVIAQELEETHPEFVNTDSEGFKSVKYIDLLIAKIAELEARLEKLEK